MKNGSFLTLAFSLLILLQSNAFAKMSPASPHIFLVSLDTVGARHLGHYGSLRNTSPFIDELGRRNITFESAFSQGAHTLVSHFSIFTGTYPQTNQVAFKYLQKEPHDPMNILSPQIKTLAEYLKIKKYQTFWIGRTDDLHLPLNRGLERGFDTKTYISLYEPKSARKELQALFEKAKVGPSFYFIHTYLAHVPYVPVKPLDKLFNPSYTRKSGFDYASQISKGDLYPNRTKYWDSFDLKNPEDVNHLEALYDAGIRSADDKIREVFNLIKEMGLYEDSIVILTSDHGEVFGARGHFQHQDPYTEELQVPLILKIPGVDSQRIKTRVESIDILPTLLEVLGIHAEKPIEGQSLLPLIKGKPLPQKPYSFAQGYKSEAIQDSQWKLILKQDGIRELYRIDVDPYEQENVLGKFRTKALKLESELNAFKLRHKDYFYVPPQDSSKSVKKLFWFIPDGMRADPDLFVVFKWAKDGKLPNIRKMLAEGAHGYSIPDFPSHTPINFASLLTGTHPSSHGIADGPMHVEGYPLEKPSAPGFASSTKRVPPIWKIFDSQGLKSVLLSIPGSTPPELRATTIRGRWGGWGADTYNVIFESKGKLPLRKELGRGFRLFFLGEPLTRFVDMSDGYGVMTAHGFSIGAQIVRAKEDSNPESMDFQIGKKSVRLHQGESSEWLPVELVFKDNRYPSQARIRVIKIWPDGNFRVRVYFDNLNKFISEPGSAAEELTQNLGPMIDNLDNWPPQLIFEPEDKTVAQEEIAASLDWHKSATGYILKNWSPQLLLQSIYTPNQMLESRWWHRDIDKSEKSYTTKAEAAAWGDILKMYQGLDAILGEAMKTATPDTLIALSSDHGVCRLKRLVHLNNLFAKKGWLKFTQDPQTGEAKIDWPNTKVIYMKMLHVYINPQGLGGNWSRGHGPEYEKLRKEVISAIAQIKDSNGIRPLVRAVKWEEAQSVYDLPQDRVGDLVLEAKVNYFWYEEPDSSLKLFSEPLTSGYKQSLNPHTNKCMWTPFVIWGPGVKKGFEFKKPISHIDQLPTLLKLMGVEIPSQVKGRVLSEALN